MRIVEPKTETELAAYHNLRYETLRKPWNQKLELDADEKIAIHAMLVESDMAIAIGRIHQIDANTWQIKGMGVHPDYRKQNVGGLIMNYLEAQVKEKNAKKIILHAREIAISFYLRCGYQIVEKSHLMWGEIQHFLMEKKM